MHKTETAGYIFTPGPEHISSGYKYGELSRSRLEMTCLAFVVTIVPQGNASFQVP